MSPSWRWRLVDTFSPVFHGMTFGAWMKLVSDEALRVDPPYWWRAAVTTLKSMINSPITAWEARRYGALVQNVEIQPPIFVIGHWRSGTTHLHNLFCRDERFAYPNTFQVMNPLTFLCTETIIPKILAFFVPKQRPFDNVEVALDVPAEDELIAWHSSTLTPLMTRNFPRVRHRFDRYLTFREASDEEVQRWKSDLILFLKKLTWKYNRPLILKSPPHTCRIKLLLGMFPQAKFVHIYRNPYTVFLSTRMLNNSSLGRLSFQRYNPSEFDDCIIRQYVEMYNVFFEERHAIPEGQFSEVCFEDLEQDPISQLRRIYEALSLPDFAIVQPSLEKYVQSLSTYTKNKYPELEAHVQKRIGEAWRRNFEAWGYEL